MNIMKVASAALNNIGQFIIKVSGNGGKDIREAYQVAPHGIDAKPYPKLKAIYARTDADEAPVIIGYININLIAEDGETRLFSTDSDGQQVFSIHLKNDGTCELGGDADFLVRFNELKSGFDAFKSDVNSFITTKYNTHTHASVGAVPVPLGSASTASIDAAKIDEIKTP